MFEDVRVVILFGSASKNNQSQITVDLTVDENTDLQSIADKYFDLLGATQVFIQTEDGTFEFLSEKEFVHRLEQQFPHLQGA